MNSVTGLQSLKEIRNTKIFIHAAEYKMLTNHPIHKRIPDSIKYRNSQTRKGGHRPLQPAKEIISTQYVLPSWERECFPVSINSILPSSKIWCRKDSDYPGYIQQWTQVYTDGSEEEGIRNREGARLIQLSQRWKNIASACPTHK